MGHPKYIAVAGNIGCGKSTLVDFMCRTYDVSPFFEPNETNPYLVDFYSDMPRWAFHSQLYFLTQKFRIHRQLQQQRRRGTVVQDRTIYEDAEIFARYLYSRRSINKRDWDMYRDLYASIVSSLEPPDLMIYLRASVRTVRQRINQRARPEELRIPTSYLRSLNKLYEEWFQRYDRSPTLIIETDNLDYVTDLEHRIDVRKTIEKYLN